jgi:nitroimidazol reductase NimA-like FMN-containing flavoprotein (pyridoxamine 5'-phosphate oxidase superfamily)/GNAT superfamily N-acetyltransferase
MSSSPETRVSAPEPATLTLTPRVRHKRRAQRGSHERALIHQILDDALVAHVAVQLPHGPCVLPMAHVRLGDALYFHGAPQNQTLSVLASGAPACVTVTLLDGLVFSREAFHHSVNYRSVVLFGGGSLVVDPDLKLNALRALIEHMAEGRWAEVTPPTAAEVESTLVVRFPIDEGSAKVRSGPPVDGPALSGRGLWGGVLPLRTSAEMPVPDALELPGELPPSLLHTARRFGLGVRTPYERRVGDLLLSTAPERLDTAAVHRFLSDESYWARGVSLEAFRRSCEHSLCFGLYRGARQLAFARVVSDFARFAYLADVFVAEQERRRGFGTLLVREVLAHPELRPVERFLLGTADAHPLYARFGFVAAPDGRYMVRRAPSGAAG